MRTGLIKVLPFGCASLFMGDIISFYSKISSNRFTLSCKCTGTLLALCFLKTASGFKGKVIIKIKCFCEIICISFFVTYYAIY